MARQEMVHSDAHMHQMDGFHEDPSHSIPSKVVNSMPSPENGFIETIVPPPDPRPPATGYAHLSGPRRELSQAFTPEPYQFAGRRTGQTLNGRSLGLRTMTNTTSMPDYTFLDRANTNSPSQITPSAHSIGALTPSPYPLLRSEVTPEESLSSPRTDRLPSFHQLSKIADGGTDGNDSRVVGLSNLSAYNGQIVTQSATSSHPHFQPSQQSSPSTTYMMHGQPSPTNVRNDGHDLYTSSHSPATFPGTGNFPSRRRSIGNGRPPQFMPSLTSSSAATSSSAETMNSHQSHQSSDAGGYSTNHTTPIESTPSSMDNTPRPPLPGPLRSNSSTSTPPGFSCDYPGCNAPPFQTQYLLNSHANVHSSNRPHYCPVKGCPRAEGGKGFKRKNEMIRHGLVHDSPGYVCPFCPLREHKYPRPDNLQRHVRVHHVDKDKDDPLLREVLAQRPEGGGRGRRRRAGPA